MAKKKKKCKGKCKELYYQGAAYLTVNTINEGHRKKFMKALAVWGMEMHKCRIAPYANLNIGAPHCPPTGCK